MVIVLERGIKQEHKDSIRSFLEGKGYQVREIVGQEETIFGGGGPSESRSPRSGAPSRRRQGRPHQQAL